MSFGFLRGEFRVVFMQTGNLYEFFVRRVSTLSPSSIRIQCEFPFLRISKSTAAGVQMKEKSTFKRFHKLKIQKNKFSNRFSFLRYGISFNIEKHFLVMLTHRLRRN